MDILIPDAPTGVIDKYIRAAVLTALGRVNCAGVIRQIASLTKFYMKYIFKYIDTIIPLFNIRKLFSKFM